MTEEELDFYEKVKQQEPLITNELQDLTQKLGFEMVGLDHRLKKPDSINEKIHVRNEAQSIHELKDIVRYTIRMSEENYGKSVNDILHSLSDNYKVNSVKNFWMNSEKAYQGINVHLTNGTTKFEIQFHTTDSLKVKQESHKLYEQARLLPQNSPQKKFFDEEMARIYQRVDIPKDVALVKPKSFELDLNDMKQKIINSAVSHISDESLQVLQVNTNNLSSFLKTVGDYGIPFVRANEDNYVISKNDMKIFEKEQLTTEKEPLINKEDFEMKL